MLYNLREYHRPTDLNEALRLLRRADVRTVVLAGGVSVVSEGTPDVEAVIDLDGLKLDFVETTGNTIRLGAVVRLQTLVDSLGHVGGGVLAEAARRMAGLNLRNAATLGGALAGGNADSPLGVVLAALGARITLYDGQERAEAWADLAPRPAPDRARNSLITAVSFDYSDSFGMAYEQVARTPADYPIVCAAAVARPGSQPGAVVAVGGLLPYPVIVTRSDGLSPDQLAIDPQPASDIRSDFLGSAEYRRSMALVMARRVLAGALIRAGLSSD